MGQLIEVQQPAQRDLFARMPGAPPLTIEDLARQRPDASWLLLAENGARAARCSLWWTAVPPYAGQRLGLIGHYAAHDPAAAAQLLRRACAELAAHDCTLAVGPMDGNTWQRYRLLTERGPEPIFFLEPDNPDDWPAHFTRSGFTVLAHYVSSLNEHLEPHDPRTAAVAERLAAQGIHIRPLDAGRFEEELRRIYTLSADSFRNNFLYTPISEEEFLAQYQGVRPYVRPELVLVAEQQDRLVGFIFAVPDLLQARRGQTIDTVVIKTIAVHPDHAGTGLGSVLGTRCQEAAYRLGYRRAIHALMHESNTSRRISNHYARPIRRYALFARELGPARS